MGRQARKTFTVNGSEYAVEAMNPVDAFRFGLDVGAALTPAIMAMARSTQGGQGAGGVMALLSAFEGAQVDTDRLFKVAQVAWQYLILPNNTMAKNPLHFQEWFAEHPKDLFPVAGLAVWKLVEDFFPVPTAMPGGGPSSGATPKA